jgi:hypothetical protein
MKTPTVVRIAAPLCALLAALFCPAPLGAQDLLQTLPGLTAGEGLGVVADVGDLNGDGAADLALGSPDDALGRGRVTVVSGANWSTLFSVAGALPGERFGAAIAAAGDVNADGRTDILVGAPGTLVMNGSARVLSGANGSTLLTLVGPSAGSRFGSAVSGAGDCNGDGKADLLVGAPGHSVLPGVGNGFAGTFSGSNGSLLNSVTGANGDHLGASVSGGWSISDQEPAEILGCTMDATGAGKIQIRKRNSFELLTTIHGPSAGSGFGASLAVLGDVNGDGKADLAVGAPGAGAVQVLSGANGSPLFAVTAPAAGTGFGSSVARVGDSNGDGHADLAVGAPLADVNGADSGAITLYSGLNGALIYNIVGGAAGDRLGASAACSGDKNGDGHPDFAVASPGADNGLLGDAGLASVIGLKLWNTVENGLPGLDGIPRLEGTGGVSTVTEASVSLTSARPITGATLVIGLSLIVDSAHGVLVPTPDIVVSGLQTTGAGTLTYDFALAGLAKGAVIYQQFLLVDSSAPGGIARSNTVAATVP